ncbi:hypothetical protein BH20ACT9_BH20ACT9_08790 [soil metagenome]
MNVGIFGDRRIRLSPDQAQETIVSVLGDVEVDASSVASPATVRLFGVLGDVTVRVRPGARVSVGGFTAFGDRNVDTQPGDGPQIRVETYGLAGNVKVVSASS